MVKTVGVILSGCGYLDGAEIHESVLTLLHLDRAGVRTVVMAPRIDQAEVVDHATGAPDPEARRDVFAESARIARGQIVDVAGVDASHLDALILPGGFGAAKNLSNFASAGADAEAHPEVVRLLRAMREAHKPIGLCCIAPAVGAIAFRGTPVQPTLTIGRDAGVAAALRTMGAHHADAPVTGIAIDEVHRIVSTPAYMYDARIADVSVGIEKLVHAVLAMA